MRSLLDVNVLIALHDEDHVHHAVASNWFTANVADGWASCPLTQNGLLRIMGQPNYPGGQSVRHLLDVFSRSFSATEHQFWPDDLSLFDESLLDRKRVQGHRQLTDLYLLALAVRHGGRLVTLDAAIDVEAVQSAGPEHLLNLSRVTT